MKPGLRDAGGSEYKLSLGQVCENGTVHFSQHLVAPLTYMPFYTPEEAVNDVDPDPANAIKEQNLKLRLGRN
jgi:hypothetical protein